MIPKDLKSLEKELSYLFDDPVRLRQSLTHKSYLNENKEMGVKDNERLEFLGDSVLGLIISDALMERFPEASEGDLSKMKARIVSEETLARIAKGIDLGSYLYLGRGEERTLGKEKPSLLADAMEAVIAAIYLDKGFTPVREVVLKQFEQCLKEVTLSKFASDYKTELQEQCQKRFGTLPVYAVVQETGPDHQKRFEIEIRINDAAYGLSSGNSKKEAEQGAAKIALEKLRESPQLS
ncbi:MAG: ribonuclease III [Nitrospira sp.]|nr:ribonuclease III [Candidatus Manganitrophaceae bacterium]HIL33877.1 ribonuclease III [Candidatus Manganitrophaceae bacterium]